MQLLTLNSDEIRNGFTHKAVITYADLQAISGSGAKAVSLPVPGAAGLAVIGAALYLGEVFAGGSISAITAALGDTGSATQYGSASDVFTGSSVTYVLAASSTHKVYTGAHGLKVTFTPTGDTVSAATTGSLTVLLRCADLTKLI